MKWQKVLGSRNVVITLRRDDISVMYTQRGHNLREPVRWASEPVEGCYPKATGSEAHRTGQFTFG